MLIGKPGAATTAIAAAASDRVTVRGRDLARDLMGARDLHRLRLSCSRPAGRRPRSSASFSI